MIKKGCASENGASIKEDPLESSARVCRTVGTLHHNDGPSPQTWVIEPPIHVAHIHT